MGIKLINTDNEGKEDNFLKTMCIGISNANLVMSTESISV